MSPPSTLHAPGPIVPCFLSSPAALGGEQRPLVGITQVDDGLNWFELEQLTVSHGDFLLGAALFECLDEHFRPAPDAVVVMTRHSVGQNVIKVTAGPGDYQSRLPADVAHQSQGIQLQRRLKE